MKDWEQLGHAAGLKFLKDDDKEALKWLVPREVWKHIESLS
tara:strand:+ start:87 stop:209 length:123 start_codon:yes stop_codon:yes gene_type:complete